MVSFASVTLTVTTTIVVHRGEAQRAVHRGEAQGAVYTGARPCRLKHFIADEAVHT